MASILWVEWQNDIFLSLDGQFCTEFRIFFYKVNNSFLLVYLVHSLYTVYIYLYVVIRYCEYGQSSEYGYMIHKIEQFLKEISPNQWSPTFRSPLTTGSNRFLMSCDQMSCDQTIPLFTEICWVARQKYLKFGVMSKKKKLEALILTDAFIKVK